ncbi:Ldh family oxidoreductase [Pseudoflavonifractor sp. 60]|uniref:Ldh family oxidoreductase n=1 Tax=Pseudoflavonifractor sp. 60 TaxID=2304576 RepID=UPI00325C0D96
MKALCLSGRSSSPSLVIDAGNTLGAPSALFAMEACIRKAAETGCCFATVKNSNHFGTAAFYTKMASEKGMIGFSCTNLTGKIAPYGAAEPFMGTNPISVAAPSNDLPVVLDMTPSVVALGKLILAQKLGQKIPLGWALDQAGNPTTDPAEGRKGSLIPIGGPKGSGMAIIVDILSGILSGAGYGPHLHDLYEFDAPQGVGHFMGAIDIAHFIDLHTFKNTLSAMIKEIKELQVAPGFNEIRLPGERALSLIEKNRLEGIELPDLVYQELLEIGQTYGLKL